VNTLFVGANTIYEVSANSLTYTSLLSINTYSNDTLLISTFSSTNRQSEIDTHLNVLHIDLNTNYNTATSTSTALSTMRSIYSRSSWHFTSPTGVKPDLHHALLSKNLGGGIAYIGVICSSTYGFGLSASLSGSYRSMGNGVVWDMNVVSLLV
jgi:hypothetical protein